MNRLIYLMPLALLVACGGNTENPIEETKGMNKEREALLEQIAEYEEYAYGDKVRMDKTAGQTLMVLYQDYVNNFRDDSVSADYLFKAGEIARNLGKYRKSISLFEEVHDGFPDYSRRTEAAFITAFIYDNDLNDREMAEKKYNAVIELYPEHKLAQDASGRLETLYLTDEELLEYFKRKNNLE